MNSSHTRFVRAMIGMKVAAGFWMLQGCAYKQPFEPVSVAPIRPVPVEAVRPVEKPDVPKPVELEDVAPLTTAYTVVAGDTLSLIAAQYGLRWQDVAGVNPGLNPNVLRVGQVIQLPGQVDLSAKRAVRRARPRPVAPAAAGEMTTYKVQKNDSLSVIAHKFGTRVAAIKAANALTSDLIREGQTLKIPSDATRQPAVASAVAPAATPAVVAPAVVADPAMPAPAVPSPAVPTPAVPAPAVPAPAPVFAPTVPAPTPDAPAAVQTYTVKEGEDLFTVAIRWGVSPSELRTLNNLTTHELRPGQILKIPPMVSAP